MIRANTVRHFGHRSGVPGPMNIQNSEIVEFTKSGKFVNELQFNPAAGGAFGLDLLDVRRDAIFVAVNDITNQLEIWKLHR